MPRRTSMEAYRKIQSENLLSKMRFKVYDHLFYHGPMTAGELAAQLKRPDEPHPSYHRRLHELEKLGVAERIGVVRKCTITGFNAEVWDVTPELPSGKITASTDKPTKKEFREALRELEVVQPQMTFVTYRVLKWIEKRYA